VSEPTRTPPTTILHHSTIREVYDQVVDARADLVGTLGDQVVEGGGQYSAIGALVALSAAVPVLDLAGQLAAGVGEVGERIAAQQQEARTALALQMADDLARALGAHVDDGVAGWGQLLDLVRQREVPFGPTIPVTSLAIALGADPSESARLGAGAVAALLGRVRQLVAAQSTDTAADDSVDTGELAQVDGLHPEPRHYSLLVDALAERLGIDMTGEDTWRTSEGVTAMLSAVASLVEASRSDNRQRARELAGALGYPIERGTPTDGWSWVNLLGDVASLVRYTREVSRNSVVELARALDVDPDANTWGGLLNLVGQLATPESRATAAESGASVAADSHRRELADALGIDLDFEKLSWQQLVEVARSRSKALPGDVR
jgi:hypothetical protein